MTHPITRNPIAVLIAAAAFLAAPLASATPAPVAPTATAKSCPAGAAIAQRTTVQPDGTIVITTRCVVRGGK